MHFVRFCLLLAVAMGWVFALSHQPSALPVVGARLEQSPIGSLPPLGKFLNPFGGAWQNAETKQTKHTEKLPFAQLLAPVQVVYDEREVPHLFAQNDRDLYFVQGYITASQRLWQMEFMSHAAAGRLSEIVGKKALNFDRLQRRKGMLFAAENALNEAMKDSLAPTLFGAYTEGVNAYIAQLSPKTFPLEYKLLDYAPEPWTPLKTFLVLKAMTEDLAGSEQDLEMTNAFKHFGKETFELLYPDFADGQDPIVPAGTPWQFNPQTIPDQPDTTLVPVPTPSYTDNNHHNNNNTSPNDKLTDQAIRTLPVFTQALFAEAKNESSEDFAGSNNWAVASEKTLYGKTFLCNDPHLTLRLPAIWFEIQLATPQYKAYGVSLPGCPAVVIGFNEHIAWGMTNAGRDVKDWYTIKFKDQTKDEYWYSGKWRRSTERIETIKIRNKPTVFDTVTYTHYGPVVYESDTLQKDNMALRWQGHIASKEWKTSYWLNRARNYNEYLSAIRHFECPGQNFVFADTSGNIAIWQQGKFVNKWKQQGLFIMDGSNPDFEWNSYIPARQNPHQKNPDRFFVSSANQHPTDTLYPYYYNGTYEYYRNRRLNQQLASMNNVKVEDMIQLQNDNYNLQAAESLPLLLSYVDSTRLNDIEKNYLRTLSKWNFRNDADLLAPAVYEAWWQRTYYLLWDEMRAKSRVPMPMPRHYVTVQFLSAHPEHPMADIDSTQNVKETAADITKMAFKQAIEKLEKWKEEHQRANLTWANYRATVIGHYLNLPAFSIENVQNGGNYGILNATSKRFGPSWRMIVSFGDSTQAFGVYPGGQSGNPGSPHYADFVEQWAKGQYYSLRFLQNPDEAKPDSDTRQSFVPQ